MPSLIALILTSTPCFADDSILINEYICGGNTTIHAGDRVRFEASESGISILFNGRFTTPVALKLKMETYFQRIHIGTESQSQVCVATKTTNSSPFNY